MSNNRAQAPIHFPKDFLWGASVSAHQVEGGQHNQWSVWELENARSLAAQAPYRYGEEANWQSVKRLAQHPANYVSSKAVNHRRLYEQDFDLLSKLNMNAFRFSLEWSRLEPEEGAWSAEAEQYYRDYLQELNHRNIEPIVTLFHFTLPVWFANKGGFERRANIKYFNRFALKIVETFGSQFKYLVIINEPHVYAGHSYLDGRWPPAKTNRRAYYAVLRNLAYAHKQVARLVHGYNRGHLIGSAENVPYIYSGDDAQLSVRSALAMQYVREWFIRKTVRHSDYIGLNYYHANRVYGYRIHNPNVKLSDMGWDMQPEHLQDVLEHLSEKYKKPILITENGLADEQDAARRWWLTETIKAMRGAIGNGVELIGYLHWSLLDNFEWDKGRWPRFGLAAVDYRTMKRTLRPSAVWFGGVIKKIRG